MNTREYLQIWSETSAEVASQALATSIRVELEPETDSAPAAPEAEGGLWMEFTVEAPISVKQVFWLAPPDTLLLGQLFMGEEPDPQAQPTPDHGDAASELFRQIAGSAALLLKSRIGKECPIQFAGSAKPAWAPVAQAQFQWSVEGREPFKLLVQLDAEVKPAAAPEEAAAADAKPSAAAPNSAPAAAAAAAAPNAFLPPPAPSGSVIEPRNLDLLLDIDLEVAIRFGRREMILREILDLNAGSVVDFEQQVEEPVELLLGNRVIGHGEVVVVDGNYGLRVTEITSARARLNSLGS